MSRLERFKRLEAPRTERSEGGKKTEAPLSPAAQRMERQVSDPPLALDTRSNEEQQFIRCMQCEADNSRYAHACVHCGSPLQTDEQRQYNEQFWQKRRSEAAQEQQAVQQLHQRRQQHEQELSEEQARVQKEAFSQMVKEAQDQAGREGQPWGIRMINGLKDPIFQWMLIGFFVLVAGGAIAGLRYLRPDRVELKWVCGGALATLVFLFTPPSWWTRRTRRGSLFSGDDDWL
jgi:hypothetical protein